MRTSLLILALAFVPTTASADPPSVSLVSGGAAIASFEQVSDDGCVTTFGDVAVVNARFGGELADGVYVTGMQEDTCAGTGNGFAGFAPGSFTVIGLSYARYQGELVVDSYSGGPSVTLDLDLRWFGQGVVHREKSWFRDDYVIEFSYSAYRNATTVGTFTLDGEPVTVTSARIGSQASGTILR
ncbi:MAG: hypothetical protein H0T46_12680 [Deltaproteobacteria bacterium]|nr:hypothetical protein [Deltaproteobacteria bacterium]